MTLVGWGGLGLSRAIALPAHLMPWPPRQPDSAPSSPSSDILLQVDGRLEPGGNVVFQDGTPFNEHVFAGRMGQQIDIALESSEFDPYLIVLAPNGDIIAQNDDRAEGDLNSFVSLTLEHDGDYVAIVNAVHRQGRGRYVLTVRRIADPAAPSPPPIHRHPFILKSS